MTENDCRRCDNTMCKLCKSLNKLQTGYNVLLMPGGFTKKKKNYVTRLWTIILNIINSTVYKCVTPFLGLGILPFLTTIMFTLFNNKLEHCYYAIKYNCKCKHANFKLHKIVFRNSHFFYTQLFSFRNF